MEKENEREKSIAIGQDLFTEDVLLCPVCGGNCLHQTQVRTIFRTSEDEDGILTNSSTGKIEVVPIAAKDIYGRRDVIYIDFECEHCSYSCDENGLISTDPAAPIMKRTLRIYQHKGSTLVHWVELDSEKK